MKTLSAGTLLVFITVLFSSYSSSVLSQTTYDYNYDEHILIESDDSTKISANIFTPISSYDGEAFPAIIFVNSWGLEEHEYIIQASKFAKKGYIVLSYSARGWGKSGGIVDTAGPNDMADASKAIDWLIDNTRVDADHIGIAGISYGAGIGLLAAAHDSRIKAVAAMSGWSNLREALYSAETPRTIWGGILIFAGAIVGNISNDLVKKYSNLLTRSDIKNTLDWMEKRSPITYIDRLNEYQVPIYLSNNYSDELFLPNQALELFSQLTHTNKKLDLNSGVHATAEVGGLLGVPTRSWNNTSLWFDYWLKGIENGVTNNLPISMGIKNHQNSRRQELSDWPSSLIRTNNYYLKARKFWSRGKLTASPEVSRIKNYIYTGLFSGANTGVPVISSLLDAHTPIKVTARIRNIFPLTGISYESNRLNEEKLIIGTPTLDLWIEPTYRSTQLIAHLYDVDQSGRGILISHAPVTLHNAVPSKPTKMNFEFASTAYIVPKGHSIALVVDTFDANYGIPTLRQYQVKFLYDSSHTSRLQIPFIKNNDRL